MASVVPNILLTASHTKGSPLAMDANTETLYLVRNKAEDIPVICRANRGASGVTKGDWVRIRPASQAVITSAGSEITQLEFYLHDSPRFASRDGVVSHAQSAQIEITTR